MLTGAIIKRMCRHREGLFGLELLFIFGAMLGPLGEHEGALRLSKLQLETSIPIFFHVLRRSLTVATHTRRRPQTDARSQLLQGQGYHGGLLTGI